MRTRLRLKRTTLVLAVLVACALGAGCNRETAPGPDVWASVNGKEILRQDVEKIFRSRVNADAPAPAVSRATTIPFGCTRNQARVAD